MRKMIAAATFTLVLGVAGAASRDEQTPESKAYLGFSFGGQQVAPRDFHYGLRLDHDSRFVDDAARVPSLMQLDFTARGINDARVNGLSVIKPQYRLRWQEEAAAEEPGIFGRIFRWFGNLFGGDEEEATETAAAAEEAPAEELPPEDIAEGVFMGYNAIDWGMLAAGAVGVGFIASEVSGGDEDTDLKDSDGDGIADGPDDPDTGGADPECSEDNPEACVPVGGFTPVAPFVRVEAQLSDEFRERLEWLDGGTGHMGDLEPHD